LITSAPGGPAISWPRASRASSKAVQDTGGPTAQSFWHPPNPLEVTMAQTQSAHLCRAYRKCAMTNSGTEACMSCHPAGRVDSQKTRTKNHQVRRLATTGQLRFVAGEGRFRSAQPSGHPDSAGVPACIYATHYCTSLQRRRFGEGRPWRRIRDRLAGNHRGNPCPANAGNFIFPKTRPISNFLSKITKDDGAAVDL